MSFVSEVKNELSRVALDQPCCARAETVSALMLSGGITLRNWKPRLRLRSSEGSVIRRYFALLKRFYGVTAQIRTLHSDAFGGRDAYQLVIDDEDAEPLLGQLGIASALDTALPADCLHYTCCQKTFLRGAFLMCGTVNPPEKKAHLEFALSSESRAQIVSDVCAMFDLQPMRVQRRGAPVVVFKSADEVATMLSLMGATRAVLKLQNVRVTKDFHNYLNRQINCDSANIHRAMQAAQQQLNDILYLEEEVGLDKLPKSLRTIAEARKENPDASLTSLGEMLEPPLGKSGVNLRLRRLSEIADKLRSGEDTGL